MSRFPRLSALVAVATFLLLVLSACQADESALASVRARADDAVTSIDQAAERQRLAVEAAQKAGDEAKTKKAIEQLKALEDAQEEAKKANQALRLIINPDGSLNPEGLVQPITAAAYGIHPLAGLAATIVTGLGVGYWRQRKIDQEAEKAERARRAASAIIDSIEAAKADPDFKAAFSKAANTIDRVQRGEPGVREIVAARTDPIQPPTVPAR